MTKLLLHLFVRNRPDFHSAAGKLAGTTGIVCNSLLFLVKLLAGLASGSVSIAADAVNNLSDAASSVMTLLGFRMAQRPADRDHPYGHARYEYFSGLAVAVLILIIGVELVKSSVEKIIHPQPAVFTLLTFLILIGSIGVKIWLSVFFRTLGKRIDSIALLAAAADSRNDVVATAAILIGCAVSHFFRVNIDGYIGLAAAGFILWSGGRMVSETVSPLLGKRADRQLVEQLGAILASYDKVLGFHDLLVHDYGPGRCYASVHVELSASEDPMTCHSLIDDMERSVLEQLHVNLVIHYDPVAENDAEQDRLRQLTEQILSGLNPALSMHDFRLVRDGSQIRLTFDLAVPYDLLPQQEALGIQIAEAISRNGIQYPVLIQFDAAE